MSDSLKELTSEIEYNLQKGLIFKAHNIVFETKKLFPDDIRINQLNGLSLARLGATERARVCLEELYNNGHRDPETAGILGGVYKDISKKSGDADYARLSRDTYLKSFESLKNYYLGINAATMSFTLGEMDKAVEIANEVLDIIREPGNDYWKIVTLGEAYIILGELTKAKQYYQKAYELADENLGNLNSSYQQLCYIAKYKDVPSEILKIFKPSGVIVFSGHMIDQPGSPKPRFPEYIADRVKNKIKNVLDELDAGIGYSSAACGSDILFIEAMLERGAEINVYLPFNKEDFLKKSVSFAGNGWVERFNHILNNTSIKFITEENYLNDDQLFSFLDKVTIGLSILRSNLLLTEPVFLTVLEQEEKLQGEGGTQDFFKMWPYKENIRIINPSELRDKDIEINSVNDKSDILEMSFDNIPLGITRSIECIFFAEITGLTRLQEEHSPCLMHDISNAINNNLESLEEKPRIINILGNSIIAIYDNARNIVEFALYIRNIFSNPELISENFSEEIKIKIALHAGPFFSSVDPVTQKINVYGAQITRTSLIGSVTLPDCIYASDQFTSILVVETGDLYNCEYAGNMQLPNDFGEQEMYHITRRENFSSMITNYNRQKKMNSEEDDDKNIKKQENECHEEILPGLTVDFNKESSDEDGNSFQWLIDYMEIETFKMGHYLFKKGDKADTVYYLKSGKLNMVEYNKIIQESMIIGETSLFSPFHTRTCSAMCETDIEIYSINHKKLMNLVYKKPSLLFDLIQLTVGRFITNLTETLEEKGKIESDLRIATAIQASMLPSVFPDRKEFDIFAIMEPAKEVGGDFYDFFFINEDKFCIIIGDVSGKGVPASLFMVISKTILKAEAMRNLSPAEILTNANSMLLPDNDECMFVTVFCAVLNIKTGELHYANAGHNPPLLLNDDKEFRFMELKKSFVLGAMENIKFVNQKLILRKNSILLLYTDGVNEAMNEEANQFSNEKFENILAHDKDKSVKEIISNIRNEVKIFAGNAPQSDDITMLSLKYKGL